MFHAGRFTSSLFTGFLFTLGGLLPQMATAQTAAPSPAAPPIRNSVELRTGYSAGRFSHGSSSNYSSLSLFGGDGGSYGQLVEHRFDAFLLGATFLREETNANGRRLTLGAGLDVLGATDHLQFADGQHQVLKLGAIHPHLRLGFAGPSWETRFGAGMMLGRVGYYAKTRNQDLLASTTTVDTFKVVPTFQVRTGFRHWVLADAGYGADGLLAMANPVWHLGMGVGFGPQSPVTLLAGVTMAEAQDFSRPYENGQYYAQLEVAPASSRWQGRGFYSFGPGLYSRVALQAAYRLPVGK
jgi:hypothetical protein